jgi:hypothetical protein
MAWYKSAKGWVLAVSAVIVFTVQRWGDVGSAISLYGAIKNNTHTWLPFLPLILFALAILFFELERRKAKYPNPKTLRGRTLQLRDRMQAFLDELGPIPQGDQARFTGISQVRVGPNWRAADGSLDDSDIVRVRGPISQREAQVDYGYELHFANDVLRIYNEFGFRGVMDTKLKEVLFVRAGYKEERGVRDVIQALSRLAELEEASRPD